MPWTEEGWTIIEATDRARGTARGAGGDHGQPREKCAIRSALPRRHRSPSDQLRPSAGHEVHREASRGERDPRPQARGQVGALLVPQPGDRRRVVKLELPASHLILRFSPVPTPRKNRPGIISVTVAAAWATIAGWILISGQVTAVPTRIWLVAPAIAPSRTRRTGYCPAATSMDGMVGDRRERETGLFRGAREVHEVLGKVVPAGRLPKRLRRFVVENCQRRGARRHRPSEGAPAHQSEVSGSALVVRHAGMNGRPSEE
jgi:hypothetical protein